MKNNLTVERIPMPSPDEFYERYMKTLTPVVITNMFEGEPISAINTKEKTIDQWGAVNISIEDEYFQAYLNAAKADQIESDAVEKMPTATVSEYWDFVAKNPDTKRMCIEFPNPASFASSFQIPKVCEPTVNDSKHFVSQCFIGNRGCVSNIHFDKAGTHGFLYQVFGKKRFIVFPHSASLKLAAFTQISPWLLQNFSEADRLAFLEFAGGQEVVLDTGDCMYVPSYSWHYADYVEDCMSISLRFRRSNITTTLANAFFPDMYLQGIASKMSDIERAKHEHADLLEEITAASNRPYPDGKAKVQAMRALSVDVYRRLYPEASKNLYCVDLEQFFPNPLPHFLDANDPTRPVYL